MRDSSEQRSRFVDTLPKGPDSEEEKELLQQAIQILKDVATRYDSLDKEATHMLMKQKNVEGCMEKLKERAQLLIDLPARLSSVCGNNDNETYQHLFSQVDSFAFQAQQALDTGDSFPLGVLLTRPGSRIGDKNDLDNLIDFLEREY